MPHSVTADADNPGITAVRIVAGPPGRGDRCRAGRGRVDRTP